MNESNTLENVILSILRFIARVYNVGPSEGGWLIDSQHL